MPEDIRHVEITLRTVTALKTIIEDIASSLNGKVLHTRPVSSGYRCDGPLHIQVLFRSTLLSKKLCIKTLLEQFRILRNGLKVDDAEIAVGGIFQT